MVHDLADPQILSHRPDTERRLIQRAPRAIAKQTRLDARALGQCQRPFVADRGWRDPTGNRPPAAGGRAQFHGNQEIGAGDAIIEPVNRQDVSAQTKLANRRGDVERLELDRVEVGVAPGGARIPGRCAINHGPLHFDAVEVGHETIIVSHPQSQPASLDQDLRRHFEGNADVTALVMLVHGVLHIDVNELLVPCTAFVADPSGAVGPGRIVEVYVAPGVAGRSRRDQDRLRRIFCHKGELVTRLASGTGCSGIGPIHGVPDRAGSARHRNGPAGGDTPAMLRHATHMEFGRFDVWVETGVSKPAQQLIGAIREVASQLAFLRLQPVLLRMGA